MSSASRGCTPRMCDRWPCGSRSMPSGRAPRCAIAASRLSAVVVLPTPPFWLKTAMVGTARNRSSKGEGTPARARGSARARTRCAEVPVIIAVPRRRVLTRHSSMSKSPIQFVILAAGQGKRMHSALPKVLHPLAGRPLLATCSPPRARSRPTAIAIVVGHGGDEVQAALAGRRPPLRAPGSAARHRRRGARRARDAAARRRHVVVDRRLPADVRRRRCAALAGVARARPARAADGARRRSARPGPHGARRRGSVRAIVEDKDATPRRSARSTRSTPACMAAPSALLAAGWRS